MVYSGFHPNLLLAFSGFPTKSFNSFGRQYFVSTITANSSHAQPAYTPPPVSTTGEGSSLPGGEVSLDQIMGLMTK